MTDMFIHVADVTGVDVVDSEVRLRVGDATREQGWSKDAPLYGLAGIVSVPLPPENGEAAQALCVEGGNNRRVIATRDNRIAAKAGGLQPGDTAIFCDNEARFLLKRDTDTVSMYTVNQKVDQSMVVSLSGENGKLSLINGDAFIELSEDRISMGIRNGCSLTIGKESVDMFGNALQALANLVLLGAQAPNLMPPSAPTNAVAVGVAGPTNTVSTKVFVAI